MSEEASPTAASVRPHDWSIAAVVFVFYFALWIAVPGEWAPFHTGGKWFLSIFVVTSGLGALLASRLLTTPELRARDNPAVWLGVQVLFWNPLAFRAVVAGVEGLGLSSAVATAAALVGLLALGLPTSLLGALYSRSPSWIVTYLFRALQCFFATWVPLIPPLAFLHVAAIAQAVTWDRFGSLHRFAVALVMFEQTAALLWFFLFSSFE